MSDLEFTDEQLIDYCFEHSQTPVGMIHRNHLIRLCKLAGDDDPQFDQEWLQPDHQAVAIVCERARTRLADAQK